MLSLPVDRCAPSLAALQPNLSSPCTSTLSPYIPPKARYGLQEQISCRPTYWVANCLIRQLRTASRNPPLANMAESTFSHPRHARKVPPHHARITDATTTTQPPPTLIPRLSSVPSPAAPGRSLSLGSSLSPSAILNPIGGQHSTSVPYSLASSLDTKP